ncbi:MAG: hypothetical protein IPL65_04990 [Lewinellaceae bacterium]|nr:hypothetical protein [Lewinellaceae bacterium]
MKNGILVKSLALAAATLLIFACGKKDPAAELAALKAQKPPSKPKLPNWKIHRAC